VKDADLFIDGRKRRPLRAKKNYFPFEPGVHTIRVAQDGYEAPPEQRVELKKGETVLIARFDLRAIPKTASLVIDGGTRDAEVLIDGTLTGQVGADGSYKREDVPPGPHTSTPRKSDSESKELDKTFIAGQNRYPENHQVAALCRQLGDRAAALPGVPAAVARDRPNTVARGCSAGKAARQRRATSHGLC
jgi:hypothetical protein